MRTRESDMPEESRWSSFFDVEEVIRRLGLEALDGDVVDFGCGYGLFAAAVARTAVGTVFALDVDPAMIRCTAARARTARLENLRPRRRDFLEAGTGRPDESVAAVLMFNNLHAEEWALMLEEARRVLRPGGRLAIMHWNHDPATPRGPSMAIRLRPEECRARAEQLGFRCLPPGIIDLPPHHFGLRLERPAATAQGTRASACGSD